MNNYYLFEDGAQMKPYVSGLDFTYNIENAASAFVSAKKDIEDTISKAVWDLAVEHYNSDNYNMVVPPEETANPMFVLLDQLVELLRLPLANFALYHHFIFLQIRVSNGGITIPESQSEKAAYRYQTDEAKEALIKAAWAGMGDVLNLLNENATMWDYWAAETAYALDEIISYSDTYYKCTEAHTSTDVFDAAKFEELLPDAMVLHEWTESEQFAESRDVFFDNERDFSKFYNIENSAYFFQKIGFIIKEIMMEDIETKYNELPELQKRMRLKKTLATDTMLIFRIKKAVAYMSIANAVLRFSGYELPQELRKEMAEMDSLRRRSSKNEKVPIKSLVAQPVLERAEKYMRDLDSYLDTISWTSDEDVVDREETDLSGEKFVTA